MRRLAARLLVAAAILATLARTGGAAEESPSARSPYVFLYHASRMSGG